MTSNVPKTKPKHQIIDLQLSENCKKAFSLEIKIKISKKFGFTPAYLNMIIRRERGANSKVKKVLEVTSNKILKTLS